METPRDPKDIAEIDRLTKLNDLKSDWISISAHQLRTTLSASKWILKMFLDNDFGKLTTEQENFLQKAYISNERMIGLVNEMLTLNHLQESTFAYSFAPHELTDIVESVVFDFMGESHKKGIEVVYLKPTESLPPLVCDIEKVRAIIQNLLENALKYSTNGDKVFISMKHIDNMIEVSVRDTGIGIPEADQPHIFEKFFRADNAKSKESVGSGLGLYTARMIAERHGGTLTFQSVSAEGTTFTLRLPLTPPIQ